MIHFKVSNLHKRFGGNHVLMGANFEINGPELIAVLAPNGVGKMTMTSILDGAIKPSSGMDYANDQRTDRMHPFEVARAGIGRAFQVTRYLRRMTVLENLYVPSLAMGQVAQYYALTAKVDEVQRFLTIEHLCKEYAQVRSAGQQKLLELGRLLMLDPDAFILDEPLARVHPKLME